MTQHLHAGRLTSSSRRPRPAHPGRGGRFVRDGSVGAVIRPRPRRRAVLVLLGLGLVVAAAGAVVFQPWKLVVDDVVDEAAPAAVAELNAVPSATGAPASGAPAGSAARTATPPAARVLAAGMFLSHEHRTTGRARVIALPGGERVLRIDDLDTSNGPDLRVWLSDAPVIAGRDGWHVFDDGRYVELGRLKGNRGSQNYPVPASVDLSRLASLTICCARFDVSFGAVRLSPA